MGIAYASENLSVSTVGRESIELESIPQFSEILGVLQYNQGLVEFADSKAGSLILVNSLLIASLGALPNGGVGDVFKVLSVIVCSLAVFFCFQVISSKSASPKSHKDGRKVFGKFGKAPEWQGSDFIFFGCITRHSNGAAYCRAFYGSDGEARRESLLQRTYIIASIAKRKFANYGTAQQATSWALAVWVLVNLLAFL